MSMPSITSCAAVQPMRMLLVAAIVGWLWLAGVEARHPEHVHPAAQSLQSKLLSVLSPSWSSTRGRRPKHSPPIRIEARHTEQAAADEEAFAALQAADGAVEMTGPRPCIWNDSQLAYINGELSATQTFFNCLSNVADPGMLPTYYNGSYHGLLVMNSSMVLNNLERVNEVEGTARLQFSLRLRWQDDRLAMPNFWSKVSAKTQSSGIDLTNVFFTNTSFVVWTPVLRFTDSSDVQFQVEFLKLNASNTFLMGIGVDCTLLQPNFNFQRYPWDEQTIAVRYNIFSMPANLAKLSYWGGNGLIFNANYDGRDTFKENPIWNFDSYSYTTYVGNSYYYWYYELNVSRRGDGIVLRLVLPITLLLCLGALTFWIVFENRVDTTITLLLSVSALYIVILGNIPLLGYLTDVDKFVFSMFFLLVVIIAAHQWYITLRQKVDSWPLRPVVMRLIELVGRTAMVPAIMIYFLTHVYRQDIAAPSTILLTTSVLVAFTGVLWREAFGLRKVFVEAFLQLLAKLNDPATTVRDTSWLEIAVVNAVVFKKWSTSREWLAQHLSTAGPIDVQPYMAVSTKLQNLTLLSQLRGGASGEQRQSRGADPERDLRFTPSVAEDGSQAKIADAYYTFASNAPDPGRSPADNFRLSSVGGIQLRDLSAASDGSGGGVVARSGVRNPLTSMSPRLSTNIDSDDEEN